MKSFILLVVAAASSSYLFSGALACRCMRTTVDDVLADGDSVAFRGTIVRQLPTNDTMKQINHFVVQVGKVFKGCDIQASNRIIVSTGANSGMCGLDLQVGTNYLLTSKGMMAIDKDIVPFLGKNTKISRQAWVTSCDLTGEWNFVNADDKKKLRNHKNRCDLTCKVGKDCPTDYYCDAAKCVPFFAPCPDGVLPTPCFADPCTVTESCDADPNTKCHSTFCGGCTAIFVAANGTRVCNV